MPADEQPLIPPLAALIGDEALADELERLAWVDALLRTAAAHDRAVAALRAAA